MLRGLHFQRYWGNVPCLPFACCFFGGGDGGGCGRGKGRACGREGGGGQGGGKSDVNVLYIVVGGVGDDGILNTDKKYDMIYPENVPMHMSYLWGSSS